ncbi:hypothetical protein [Enterobacter ludwigii]|uniref:hypothetical protein n=1 Tax=Enterobacter ludwigii TaxID=299767 RepID=UPI0039763650
MKKLLVKAIVIAASFITLPASTATLQCESLKGWALNGTSVLPEGSASILINNFTWNTSALGSPKVKNYHVTLNFPSTSVSDALAGNWVQIYNQSSSGNASLAASTAIPSGVTQFSVTIPCVANLSTQCDYKNTSTWVLLSSTQQGLTKAAVNTDITLPLLSNPIEISMLVTSNNIQVSDQTITGSTTLLAKQTVTDSMVFPDYPDLGSLSAGKNNNLIESMTYTMNTNNIPINIQPISPTESTLLVVNNEIVQAARPFTPPLKFGLNLASNAQPGNKSVTVYATWTCP